MAGTVWSLGTAFGTVWSLGTAGTVWSVGTAGTVWSEGWLKEVMRSFGVMI